MFCVHCSMPVNLNESWSKYKIITCYSSEFVLIFAHIDKSSIKIMCVCVCNFLGKIIFFSVFSLSIPNNFLLKLS